MDAAIRMDDDQRTLRVVVPGVGCVDIDRGLTTADGNPRVRVDVISDFDRFGTSPRDGRRYVVENADHGPGVVYLTGHLPDPEPVNVHEPVTIDGEAMCKRDGNDWPCPDASLVPRETLKGA